MINKLIRELKKDVVNVYGVNKITPAIIIHHGIKNYVDIQKNIKKYAKDNEKLLINLLSFIRQENRFFHKRESSLNDIFSNEFQLGNNSIIFKNLSPEFERIFANTEQDPYDTILNKIYSIGLQLDLQKNLQDFQKNPQLGKAPINSNDVSFYGFLRALFHLASSNNIYFIELAKVFQDSNFDIEKFIEDYEKSETDKPSIIEELCENLNEQVLKGKILPAIGRDKEINEMINILKKARKNNPILVGKAGVGKTAIAEGLAWLIVNKQVPKALENAVIYNLQVMDMIKGTAYRGQFEEKMSKLINDFKIMENEGEILPILFIDEIHSIIGSGNNNGLDFANIIKPALARGELRTIGSTTTDEWHQFIKDNPALDRRLVSVIVKEPSKEETINILERSINFYEKAHNIIYEKEAIKRAVDLTDEFITDNAFPDKAFDLLDFVGAMNHLANKNTVQVNDIEEAISKQKNIAIEAVRTSNEMKKPLANILKENLFGQDEIIDKVAKSVEKSLAGLGHKDKPIGSFLFLGQTGTGKTQLAKDVAKAMNAHFHRIDMSEFMESHSVSKLIGSPPGYVGYENGSSLTKVLIENPRTVLLLDEIEKAHPQVKNIFLQSMDNAKITDSKGKEISFRNVLLILTSNAGAEEFSTKQVGLTPSNSTSKANNAIKQFFTPEFRARLTGNTALFFNPMTKELLTKIANKEISLLKTERLIPKKIELSVNNEVIEQLVNEAESFNLGARPLKDLIEKSIVEEISDIILYNEKYKNNQNNGTLTKIDVFVHKNNIKIKII